MSDTEHVNGTADAGAPYDEHNAETDNDVEMTDAATHVRPLP
jgi:hypothetical protein